ncbi:uncharacterized protein LOC128822443 isoform X2 [Vidua macroura]|uniref:uncharacterized protein LOC128822443 isoform X2 n=1 Tax=Vidua macroura TaxID=187451 RepID=UPI0023A8D5C1|nr:uncharacterized protein LOC128822443 isoform X2 [Vidua macroura]
MGEPPEAMVIKTFGGLDETCEPLLKKHMGSYPRGILAPCKDLHPVGVVGADPGQMSEAERRRIEADFERLRRLLAEQKRTVLGRLAELDHTFAATHAEKSLRVTEGVAQLHRLIGQLEARCLPQVSLHKASMASAPTGSWPTWWWPCRRWLCSWCRICATGTNDPSLSSVTVMESLSAPPAPSIAPTLPCCSKRPLAATGSINPFSLQKQFEASLKTLQEEDKRCAGLTEAAKETRQEMLT